MALIKVSVPTVKSSGYFSTIIFFKPWLTYRFLPEAHSIYPVGHFSGPIPSSASSLPTTPHIV